MPTRKKSPESEKPSDHSSNPAVTADAIEGDKARLEVALGQTKDIARSELPEGVKEGDVLREVDGKLEVNKAETESRRFQAKQQLEAVNREADSSPREIDL